MNFKLDKEKISNMAVFSTALLTPSVVYGMTTNESVEPSRVAFTCLFVAGTLVVVNYTKKRFEKKRLYDLHKNAIPLQEGVIKDLEKERRKNDKRGIDNAFLSHEIDFERSYLDMLKEEESLICENLNLDVDNEEEMSEFIEEVKVLKKRRK